jgi:transposase-like protein
MTRYSIEFKEAAVQKMMPPNAVPVREVRRETGVSDVTLYKWRNEYRNKGIAVPGDDIKPDHWHGQDKLAVVIETAALNESELSEYCRNKGLYPEQVQRWKEAALKGYESDEKIQQRQLSSRKEDKRKIKKLESELRRKEKALAETAALLVLRKKAQAIWGEEEDV